VGDFQINKYHNLIRGADQHQILAGEVKNSVTVRLFSFNSNDIFLGGVLASENDFNKLEGLNLSLQT